MYQNEVGKNYQAAEMMTEAPEDVARQFTMTKLGLYGEEEGQFSHSSDFTNLTYF